MMASKTEQLLMVAARVLVVSGPEVRTRALRAALFRRGLVVTSAPNLVAARYLLACDRFDAVVAWIARSVGNGFDLVGFVRHRMRAAPVVLLVDPPLGPAGMEGRCVWFSGTGTSPTLLAALHDACDEEAHGRIDAPQPLPAAITATSSTRRVPTVRPR